MNKVKETKANCLYVFQGRSCAKCEIVRNLAGAKEFIKSANERFLGFMKIRSYAIAQDTWTLIVELEDEKTIVDSYLINRNKSGRAKKENRYYEVWRMISDCMRHWLSRFVKLTNYQSKREGTLRMRSYERFYFESLEEAEKYMKDMMEQRISISQRVNRFRPSRKKWALRKCGIGHVYLCVKNACSSKIREVFGSGALHIDALSSDVLRKIIAMTKSNYFSQNNSILSLQKE